jgi:nucleoside 2-deoxyribosyltransferase
MTRTTERQQAAREEIERALIAIEQMRIDGATSFEEGVALTQTLHVFRFGRDEGECGAFTTLDHAKQLIRLLPDFLRNVAIPLITRDDPDPTDFTLIGEFVMNVGRIYRTRTEQSASGRGDYGRETMAKAQEEIARLKAELATARAQEEVA